MSVGATIAVCALAGVPAGWFGAALYERVPADESVLRPPVRFPTSGRGATVVVLTVIAFGLAGWRFAEDGWVVLGSYLLAFTVLTALSVIDYDTLRLPDKIVVPSIVVAVPLLTAASYLRRDSAAAQYAIVGGAVYFGFLLVMHLAFPRGMGFGDVKLAALMGMLVGWLAVSFLTSVVLVFYAMLVGFILGSVVGIGVFIARRKSKPIPFGPFLVVGVMVTVLFAPALMPSL